MRSAPMGAPRLLVAVVTALAVAVSCVGATPRPAVALGPQALLLFGALPHAAAGKQPRAGGLKKKAKKQRHDGDAADEHKMKSTIGAWLQGAWRGKPSHEQVKQASLVMGIVLIVGCVRFLQNEANTPRREFGAPKNEDGFTREQVAAQRASAKAKVLDPLAKKVREALDREGAGRGAAALRFRDEDSVSAELSRENMRCLATALDAACDACRPGSRKRCWWGDECYRKNLEHLKSWAHPGDKDWFTVAAATARKHLKLEVTLAGASPAALKAAEPHFEEADGYRGGAPVASVTLYMAHHTGLLQQFLKQVLAKVQQFIHLKPTASVLTPEQFCVVLQASREVARMMDGGATVDDILNSNFTIVQEIPAPTAAEDSTVRRRK